VDLSKRFAPLPIPAAPRSDVPLAHGEDKPHRQKGGRSKAEAILADFFGVRNIQRYPFQISSPLTAWDGCSRISAYLAYGVVSDSEVFQAVDRVVTEGHQRLTPQDFEKLQERARFYLDRLMWRRSYIQSLEDNPRLETDPSIVAFQGARDNPDPELFAAWCAGRTGFPFIDALMRCLHKTGWINMRGRAALVSFATMNLWQPTVRVAEYLAGEFLDYDPAVHFPIHQVVSGQAAAENGVMVYDPVKQGKDHDPEGHFVRRWVPELADLAGCAVHDVSRTAGYLSEQASKAGLTAYPVPIVDHKVTGRAARTRVHQLQNDLKDDVSEVQAAQLGLL
jgi:deoxyribodipyrimidine photo-lyase